MKTSKYINVHDKEVTPLVYHFLFTVCPPQCNDSYQELYVEELVESSGYCQKVCQEAWEERLKRGYGCYYDRKAMEEFLKNPPNYIEAVKQFKTWIREQGWTEADDPILVKIWW